MELIIDAGNKNIKAILINSKGEEIDKVVLPSLLRFTEDSDFVVGGFNLEGTSAVVGRDNINRSDTIRIIEESRGKINYLPYLLAGTVSHFSHLIKQKSVVNCHVLTLQVNEKDNISSAIDKLNKDLKIDRQKLNVKFNLSNVYPEGFGAGAWGKEPEKNRNINHLYVLDIGGGTMNLTRYCLKGKLPRREYFNYSPTGMQMFLDLVKENLKYNSSNGRVDEFLLNQALESNSYMMLDTLKGTHIWDECYKSAITWLNHNSVKPTLIQVINCLQLGETVVCCGGSWNLAVVRESFVNTLKEILPEDKINRNLIFPDNPTFTGVQGTKKLLWKN